MFLLFSSSSLYRKLGTSPIWIWHVSCQLLSLLSNFYFKLNVIFTVHCYYTVIAYVKWGERLLNFLLSYLGADLSLASDNCFSPQVPVQSNVSTRRSKRKVQFDLPPPSPSIFRNDPDENDTFARFWSSQIWRFWSKVKSYFVNGKF